MKRFHALSISFALLVASVLMSPIAHACLGEFSESSIFFDEQDLKAGIDGQVVVEAAIIELTAEFVGIARIDKIIKGAIDKNKIVITTVASSCTRGFGVGASGIVVGSLERNAHGELTLVAKQESNHQREARRKAHATPARL